MSNLRESSNSGSDTVGTTTLFIRSLAGELRHDEIVNHFSAFGAVNNVRIRNLPKNSYGLVKFTLPESAAQALAVDDHLIVGRSVRVVAASDRHQADTSFLYLPEHMTTFMDLNDDCILEILSMKCLTVMDLCSAAEASRRLKEIASRVFKRKHKNCVINLLCNNLKTAKRILMTFGSEITEFESYGIGWTDEVMKYVTKYCGTTLQSLDLQFFGIPENVTAEFKLLFKNLQKLRMSHCFFEGASTDLFDDCGSLVELNLDIGREYSAFVLEKTFSKLERFSCCLFHDSNSFDSFISRHVNLKSLKIGYVESSSLQLIAQYKRLETLKCHVSANTTFDLSNLGRLRQLEIHGHGNAMKTLLGFHNLISLEQLTLERAEIDSEFIGILSELKHLRVLNFRWFTGLRNLNRIGDLDQLTTLEIHSTEPANLDVAVLVKRLNKLNSLAIILRGFEMDLAKYLRVVDVVRRRPDKSKLKFRLGSYGNVKYDNFLSEFSQNAHVVEMDIGYYR